MSKINDIQNSEPITWATSPSGHLFGVNGWGPPIKWDGQTALVQSVGVKAPVSVPSAAWSGVGTITGTYSAYMRFVDNLGNVSNVSPISNNAVASSNATITYSGLDLAATGATLTSDVAKITRRQILRNTAGQTTTYYVDIDTTDVTSSSLTSTNTDAQLTAGITLLSPATDGGTAIAATALNVYGLPPYHKKVIASHLGRMFAAVDAVLVNGYTGTGCIQVKNGSTAATPIEGITALIYSVANNNRFLYVDGATQPYQISAIQGSGNNGQALLLTKAYADSTDNFATYAIRPDVAERRLIYYSQANLPESWPATNALKLQEDGDEITGLMPFASFLYILENRHIYRLTFQSDPAVDGGIYLALNRGCINQRCWVLVEGTAYMLDEQGIHAFGGGRDSEPVSNAVQDLFRFSDSDLRVNWLASKWFHAVHYAPQEVIRWFVAFSGQYLPYHAICYNYRQKRWWIEQWAAPIGASCSGRLGRQLQTPQVYMGSTSARVLAMWQGTLDGVSQGPTIGFPRGPVSVAFPDTFTGPGANFIEVANTPVSIVDGTGKGQQRIVAGNITQNGNGFVKITQPWLIQPDKTSVYQFGGIPWRVQFGWWRTLLYEQLNERDFKVIFQPVINPALGTVRIFTDFGTTPMQWVGDFTLTEGNGVRIQKNSADAVWDMTKTTGYIQKRFPGHREFYADGVRYLSLELSGVTNLDVQRIYWVMAGGVEQG